jgi:hypothetical protein
LGHENKYARRRRANKLQGEAMPTNILLVHGYSVRSLDAYGLLPTLLKNDGFNAQDIFLSAYDSLNDDITCDDLSRALEERVRILEQSGLDLGVTAVIVHSTGAIIVRRWLLNRWKAGGKLPSHFVSLAGANHGSTLAQLGETQLAYLFRELTGGTSVGLEVLQDLDYGSEFLLKLNEDWLDAYLSNPPPPTLPFSLIGDDHSSILFQIAWQTHENGSDSTVRVSGGNLNYRFMSYDQTATHPALTIKQLPYQVPHLVLHGISHTGKNGILGGNASTMTLVYPHIKEALGVSSAAGYSQLAQKWNDLTAQWNVKYPVQCNSTIVFSLKHPGGRNVKDSLILIKDQTGPAAAAPNVVVSAVDEAQSVINVKSAIEDRQPIQNNFTPSSVSFYVNYAEFIKTYPHTVQIQINSGSPEVTYRPISYLVIANQTGCIRPNEFLYAKVTLDRQSLGTYVVIPQSENPDVTKTWPPMPS